MIRTADEAVFARHAIVAWKCRIRQDALRALDDREHLVVCLETGKGGVVQGVRPGEVDAETPAGHGSGRCRRYSSTTLSLECAQRARGQLRTENERVGRKLTFRAGDAAGE